MKRILSFWMAIACFGGEEVFGQETLEIRYTKDGVSHTVEVNRNIRQLVFSRENFQNTTGISSITLPEGLTNLEHLNLYRNQLTSFTLPNDLTNLRELVLSRNQLTNLVLPEGLTNLWDLNLSGNQLTSFTLPEGLTNLRGLHLSGNQLTSFTFPNGLTNLESISLGDNQLASFALPEGLTNLEQLRLSGNPFTSLTLPEGLTNLERLYLGHNQQLTSLTLARDTAERFAEIDTDRGLAYNLEVSCFNVPLRKVILPKRLDGKVSFHLMANDVYGNLEFFFLEDLDFRSPRITRAGDALEITWAVGVLQTSAGIEGPWKDVRASSPLRIFPRPSLPAEFFRVRAE